METRKKITICYSGSFVNTIKVYATLFLLGGLVASAYILLSAYDMMDVIVNASTIILSSIFLYLILIATSKALQHLLYIRKYFEAKAFDEGFDFVEEENNSQQ